MVLRGGVGGDNEGGAGEMAGMGISMYAVLCENPSQRSKDFFAAMGALTGGQCLHLSTLASTFPRIFLYIYIYTKYIFLDVLFYKIYLYYIYLVYQVDGFFKFI